MKATFNHSAVTQIVLAFALTTFVGIQQMAMAGTGSGEGASSPSASETLRGALDNVRHRYNQTLDYYGLTELYYGETGGVCALKLDKPGRTEPLSILYVRSDNTIEYSQVIPKGLAQQLINDRMLIDSYKKVLRSDGEGATARKEKIKAEVSERTKRRIKLADSATKEQVHEILGVGPRGNARVESYLELCERVNKGERLNEEEQARYDRDRALIGKYMELGGRVRRRDGDGPSRRTGV